MMILSVTLPFSPVQSLFPRKERCSASSCPLGCPGCSPPLHYILACIFSASAHHPTRKHTAANYTRSCRFTSKLIDSLVVVNVQCSIQAFLTLSMSC